MDKEKFIALGRQLGLENEELREWVERECVEARDERAKEREIAKENAERQQKLLEQQQKVQEQELKILELKLRLQESASRPQSTEADVQGGSGMSTRERTCALAHEELKKAKKLQKGYYDKKARKRELVPGDQVLALLPADNDKLVLSWQGPFSVVEKRSIRQYLVNLGDKVTLLHINMLKKDEERKPLSQQMTTRPTTRSRVYYNRKRKPHDSNFSSPASCFLDDRPFNIRCDW
ncbi:hypothetical protein MTO96_012174 [Rhipicephalus appendiculatus]